MRYTDEKISVVFDDSAGFTKAIYNPKDKFNMNWILDNSNWGEVIGFNEYRVEKAENGINVYSKNNSLGLSVEKRVQNGCYTEIYETTPNFCTSSRRKCGFLICIPFLRYFPRR